MARRERLLNVAFEVSPPGAPHSRSHSSLSFAVYVACSGFEGRVEGWERRLFWA